MDVDARYSMSELAARSGVPPATIHHYVRRGLLPPPHKVAAKRFLYDQRHLQGAQLVRLLRERRRLPLEAIAKILPGLLELDSDQAFRPQMWDEAVGLHIREVAKLSPKARLLEAAKESFAQGGYDSVNVDDICRSAHIAKASLYRHFGSKEELFFATAEAAASDVVRAFEERVGPRGVGAEKGAEILSGAARELLPIFLDLIKGTLQRRPGYRQAAVKVMGQLAERLTSFVPGTEQTRIQLVEQTVARLVGEIIAEPFELEAATQAEG
jgi:AcrR family transcriptional regulator